MEIILKEDVIGLGYKHDIVNVKPGYGRNYLIPQGKGVIASESAKKQLAEELKQKAKKLEKIKADAQALADKLTGVALTIEAKVSNSGTIYGSVNNVQIADELSKLGFDIDRKLILIKDVKTVGEHQAVVRLHKEVSVVIPVTVVPDAPIAAPEPAPAVEAPAAAEAPEVQDEAAAEAEVLENIDAAPFQEA
ncbi:MAG: 50S ribosomal protein L9 [Bacteroidaceae bacterium]|nr:50S ribosomal protein L9 [Bacteroidaceae bacterium]